MKALRYALKAGAALLIPGLLGFSCVPFTTADYESPGSLGTLVVALPGGLPETQAKPRGAVSPGFAATLTYRVACAGPGDSVSLEARPGDYVSILLNPGDWAVTVTALNAAGQSIGSGAARAAIESGKTSVVQLSVSIDTGGCDITRFAITSPVSAAGDIDTSANTITVRVMSGTDRGALSFSATHTGVSISPAAGPLDFSASQTAPVEFTVTAENGGTKTWTVIVYDDTTPGTGTPGTDTPGTDPWPDDSILGRYGLSGLTQPPGTTVSMTFEGSGTLMVQLENAGTAAYNQLVDRIKRITGETGVETSPMGIYVYELVYAIADEHYELNLVCDINGIAYAAGSLILTVAKNTANSSYTWPDESRWAPFKLSGLTQPAGTGIVDVSEMTSPYLMVSVTMNRVSDTAYEALYDQIAAQYGAPYSSSGSAGSISRDAAFMITPGEGTIMAGLSMDTDYDEMTVYAMLLSSL
jgi:hypothetical protein